MLRWGSYWVVSGKRLTNLNRHYAYGFTATCIVIQIRILPLYLYWAAQGNNLHPTHVEPCIGSFSNFIILLLSLQKFRNSAHTMPRGITWVIHAQLPIKTLKWLAIQHIPAGKSLHVHPWRSSYIFCIDPYRNAIRQAPYWCNDVCLSKSVRRMTIQANEVHLWTELNIVIYYSTLHFRRRILFRNMLT